MNPASEKSKQSKDFCEKSCLGSKIKVSSYTQVEPEFVGAEFRSIVGQEDVSESYVSKRIQDTGLRKQNKGVRPPLVGQASSSSNDSVSLSFERRLSDAENGDPSPTYPSGLPDTYTDVNTETAGSNYNKVAPYLLNRDDYINQRPPEGSSGHAEGLVIQPIENAQEFQKIRSPSSASSVTSSRPLEWDSLADVGYNQHYPLGKTTDPGMSTVERMALVCGTNFLTRSDPEGTTGPSGQPQPTLGLYKSSVHSQIRSKSKLGYPNAESTPMGTCATSDVSPETASVDLSPIVCENSNKSTDIEQSSPFDSSHEVIYNRHLEGNVVQTSSSPTSQKTSRSKFPLFPEIVGSLPQATHQDDKNYLESTRMSNFQYLNNNTNLKEIDLGNDNYKVNIPKQSLHTRNKTQNFKLELQNELYNLKKGSNTSSNIVLSKKISSSLENISSVSSGKSDVKNNNTLPRSQSQSSLQADNSAHGSTSINNGRKYNMAVHSIIQYNKSASSSSIATVVNRKGDSPKHVFAQTSFKLESVGIQVGDDDLGIKHTKRMKVPFNETPHLPKSALTQKVNSRSNYFNCSSSEEVQEQESKCKSRHSDTNQSKAHNSNRPVHSHGGVLCTGAHRKVSAHSQAGENPILGLDQSQHDLPHQGETLNSVLPSNARRSAVGVQGSFRNINYSKTNFGTNTNTGTLDSIESSAKSGGGWTDKQCSMAVEDRVNSFEYLPGHVYENAERQHPVDSRDTSSMSIHNQASLLNNEMGERDKLWDNSGSASSNFEQDIRRGVEIFSDFIKGSCASDSALKKKLIGRVVERLTTKTYSNELKEPTNLSSNVPWVPSRPQNPLERNGRETRRSVNRSKVPCEFSSRSEKSGSTNASSDCFIPRPAASSTFLPSSLRDNSAVAGQNTHSSTSEISIEKSSKNHGRPPQPLDIKAQIIQNGSLSKDDTDVSSSKHGSNWKEPVTKSEKLLEEKKSKKKDRPSSRSQSDEMSLVQYLNMERENQLFWIKSEIQHLSNLKELLEKQENLKQQMKGFKSRPNGPSVDILKDRNSDRLDGVKMPVKTSHLLADVRQNPQSKYRPTLSAWLEKTTVDSKATTPVHSELSGDTNMEDWASHHYKSGNEDNLKSCMKKKSKLKHTKEGRRPSLEENMSRAIYDEPPLTARREKSNEKKLFKPPLTPYCSKKEKQVDESFFVTEKGVTKRNVQTETLNTVGVQTTDSVQQLPVVHPNWFKHAHSQRQTDQHCRCACACASGCRRKCCGESVNNNNCQEEEKPKSPVGYYITFEPSPRGRDKLDHEQRPLEEVRIQVPMSEPELRSAKRPKSRFEPREKENIPFRGEREQTGSERGETNTRESGTETTSSKSSASRNQDRPHSGRPIYHGGTGPLQYYLLRNRPTYVSRAEDRRQCIAQMQYLRELRDQSKRRLLTLTEPQPVAELPPPPLAVRRVFSQQTMRRQTEKKYRELAEVRGKQIDTKRKQGYRTNRLMAEIFTKKLQKRVLKGEVNLSNSVSVISNL